MAKSFKTSMWREKLTDELLNNVTPFWLRHSLDSECGGYFNCLDRDGSVYDTTKHMWLQSRMVWMYSRLYNQFGKNSAWLDAARMGLEFITRHGITPEGRAYFSLTRQGKPVFIQRKLFSECFYSMALDEYSRATGDERLAAEALLMFDKVIELADNPSLLGRPELEGQPEVDSMAVPMMLLCCADQLCAGRENFSHSGRMSGWVEQVMSHIDPQRKIVLENVAPGGGVLPGSEGRLLNPGHAIEAGWFVLEYARTHGEQQYVQRALEMIEWSFERGWDKEHGGIYYFLDAENRPPVQLEWQMKLWWPHCEALYGMLLAWKISGRDKFLQYFEQTWDYIETNLIDTGHGEWFGYLDRQGHRTHELKGGPYKCFFHVPRTLMLCVKLLEEIEG